MVKIKEFNRSKFKRLYIEKTTIPIYQFPEFYNHKKKYVLYGDYIYYASEKDKNCTVKDFIGVADTESELLMQCAILGLNVS